MNIRKVTVLLILVISFAGADDGRSYSPLLIDSNLSMGTGVETIVTAQNQLGEFEDHFIGTQWFDESSLLKKTGAVFLRFGKYALLDVPADYFSVVLSHEYYGHGARYRAFGIEDIHYGYDLPPPYGNGGGEATSHIDDPISNHELIGIWQGGIEIHPLINRELSLRWMTEKRIDYRQASLYFWSFQIMTTYVQDTVEDLNDGVDDNDPRAYIRLLNAEAGIADPEDFIMTVGDLKSKMNLDLLNPFAIYSMWTILKTYLWNGDVSNKLFCLNLGEVRYLPSLRTGLTPFGIQYHLENYFRYRQMVGLIDVSLGDQTFYNSWGGLGILVQNVYEKDRLSLNLKCDFWDQPQLRLGENADPLSESKTGGAVSVRVYYDLPGTTYPWAAVFEAGYKSEGFLEGYAFDASPVLLIGVAIRN